MMSDTPQIIHPTMLVSCFKMPSPQGTCSSVSAFGQGPAETGSPGAQLLASLFKEHSKYTTASRSSFFHSSCLSTVGGASGCDYPAKPRTPQTTLTVPPILAWDSELPQGKEDQVSYSLRFIYYLFGRQSNKERGRHWRTTGSFLQVITRARSGPGQSQSQKLHLDGRGSSIWALPRHISRKQDGRTRIGILK